MLESLRAFSSGINIQTNKATLYFLARTARVLSVFFTVVRVLWPRTLLFNASALPGSLLGMKIARCHLTPTKTETVFQNDPIPSLFPHMLKLEKYCTRLSIAKPGHLVR